MATPETLVQFAQYAGTLQSAARSAANTALAGAHGAQATAQQNLAALSALLAQVQSEIAAKRAQLAAADVPAADADALVAEIGTLQQESRALQARILDAGDQAADAGADAAAATSALARAEAGVSEAAAELATDTPADARRDAWKTAAVAPPLQTLGGNGGEANAALGGGDHDAAKTRIESELPAEMVAAARAGYQAEAERADREQASLEAAQDLLGDALAAHGGTDGAVAQAQLQMDRAEEALRLWVQRGQERFTGAVTQLKDVVATPALLTPAEAQALTDLAAAGAPAAGKLSTRQDKQEAVYQAQSDYDDALMTALAPDPSADVSAVAAVKNAHDALVAAQNELQTAEGDYDNAARAAYAAWAAAVPDAAWRKVVGFLEAERTLGQLKGTDAQGLVDALSATEKTLAEALVASTEADVTVGFLDDEVTALEQKLTQARASRAARLLSATRGDD